MQVGVHNPDTMRDVSMQDSDNIQVLVRMRPPNTREQSEGYQCALQKNGASVVVEKENKPYAFDHVVDQNEAQVAALRLRVWFAFP